MMGFGIIRAFVVQLTSCVSSSLSKLRTHFKKRFARVRIANIRFCDEDRDSNWSSPILGVSAGSFEHSVVWSLHATLELSRFGHSRLRCVVRSPCSSDMFATTLYVRLPSFWELHENGGIQDWRAAIYEKLEQATCHFALYPSCVGASLSASQNICLRWPSSEPSGMRRQDCETWRNASCSLLCDWFPYVLV